MASALNFITAGLQFLTASATIITDDLKEYLLCSLRDGTACYSRYDSLTVGFAICLFFTTYCFVWSIVGKNCSKVDQIWSIVPVLYCWHFFVHYSLNNKAVHYRLLLLSILVTLWGARLTFNFARKNGYGTFFEHEEDYRWPILRKLMHPVVFLLFNISFIASYQNLLLYYIAAPAYVVMKGPTDNNVYDILVGGLFSIMLLIETVADEQHWIFQSYKHSLSPEERLKDADPQVSQRGFLQEWPVSVLPPSQLLRRAIDVGVRVSVHSDSQRGLTAGQHELDHHRLHPAHPPVPRKHIIQRVDHGVQVPFLQGVSAHHLPAHSDAQLLQQGDAEEAGVSEPCIRKAARLNHTLSIHPSVELLCICNTVLLSSIIKTRWYDDDDEDQPQIMKTSRCVVVVMSCPAVGAHACKLGYSRM